MNIEASEYMDASNTVVTDTLPNGYCPLGATGTTYWSAESTCTASDSDPKPNPGYANVTWDDASKTYNVVFQPVASITANGSATVTLPARMLPNYRNGDALGARTVAGDNFVNKVELTGTTTPITGVDGGPETVGDTSQAEQGTPLPKISKEIKTRAAPPAFPGGMKCDPGTPPSYVSDPDPLPDFRKGDVICFKLRVDFPKTIDTKNAVVTDFPPVGTEFVVDNQPDTGNNKFALTTGPDGNNVPVAADLSATKFVLTLGTGGFVAQGRRVRGHLRGPGAVTRHRDQARDHGQPDEDALRRIPPVSRSPTGTRPSTVWSRRPTCSSTRASSRRTSRT